jgi:hypothetical protein
VRTVRTERLLRMTETKQLTNGTAAGASSKARDRAAAASVTLAVAQARDRRAAAAAEYEKETSGLLFTKDFNTDMEATMRDRLNGNGERYLAWLKRYSWGEYSTFAIGVDGWPKTQQDAANELGMKKQVVSNLVIYYEARGYLRREGKKMYPVIAPQLSSPLEKVTRSHDKLTFREFLESWKVTHSHDFSELEVARSTVLKIRKAMLCDYKKSRHQATNAPASLLEIAREEPGDSQAGSVSSTPFEENNRRRGATANTGEADGRTTQPKNGSVGGGVQSNGRKSSTSSEVTQAREYLFSEISRMQNAYPSSAFSATPIDRNDPEHQRLINLILKKLGGTDEENLVGFVVWVAANFKGLGFNARKRAPGTRSGPESLGLLVPWAEDYAAVAGGRGSEPRPCSVCGQAKAAVNGRCFDCAEANTAPDREAGNPPDEEEPA